MWETWLDWTDDLPLAVEQELAFYRSEAARWASVGEYVGERLIAYYDRNPNGLRPAFESLQQARALFEKGFHAPAVVFAVSATEIAFTRGLIEPLVVGSVSDPLIEKLVKLFRHARGLHLLEGLIIRVFQDTGLDLNKHLITELNQRFWGSLVKHNKIRNEIVHGGASAEAKDASDAIAIAAELIERLFPMMLEKHGLHLHEGPIISTHSFCQAPRWISPMNSAGGGVDD